MDADGGRTVQAIADLAKQAKGVVLVPRSTGPRPETFAVPEGVTLQEMPPVKSMRPERIGQVVELVDVDSFTRYLNEHKDCRSRIFAQVLAEPYGLTAILDYHAGANVEEVERAEFKSHVCKLVFTPTDAWKEWAEKSGDPMAQDDFALFVEERQPDIVEPKGADLLELAKSIAATRGVKFDRRIRLDNGSTALHFDDKTEATAGLNGQLTIPDKLVLKFPIFLGMPNQCIECRFRYRLQDGGRLVLSYEIVRKQQLLLDAMRNVLDIVMEATGVPSFLGKA